MPLLKLLLILFFSMARAILKRNKILFMDEATASIDCTSDFLRERRNADLLLQCR